MALKLVKGVAKVHETPTAEKSREAYLLACLREEKNDPRFSDWERQFIASVARQADQGRQLTAKQKATLERIWGK